jgi:hypothetical protein
MTFDDEATASFPTNEFGRVYPASGTYRNEGLAAFEGLDAAGDWVLTIADCCADDRRFFHSMTLQVTVPDPSSIGLLISALAGLGFARQRKLY